jgi:anthranilate synthase component 1
VETHPIAGTRKRGATPAADAALEKELLADIKERSEHVMLVDLGRNDVGRVSTPGSVAVESLMGVERYSHVMHIVSVVTGQLGQDKTPYDAFRAIFPAGTLSGAPKVRAMQLVAGLESQRRGIYGGAVGWWGYDGCMDTAIAIRTCVIQSPPLGSPEPRQVHLQAGGGIVFDSDPQDEWEETVNKLGAAVAAVAGTMRRTGCK